MELTLQPLTRQKSKTDWRRRFLFLTTALLLLVVIAYVAISAFLAAKLSETTRQQLTTTPAQYGLTYENVRFAATDGIPLAGWYMNSPGAKTVIVLHGQDGVRDDPSIGLMDIDRALVQHGYAVFTFDFRGYGESGGDRFSLGDLEVRDVAGVLNYLKTRRVTQVGALGFSMGAVTALNSAPAHPEMRAIVADSSFADVVPIIEAEFPRRSHLPSIFIPGMLLMGRVLYGIDLANDRPVQALAQLGDRPVLLIYGTSGDYVPLSQAQALQAGGANDPNLQSWVVPGAGHVRAYRANPDEYMRRVIAFFDRNLH